MMNTPFRAGNVGINNSSWWRVGHPTTFLFHDTSIDTFLHNNHGKLGTKEANIEGRGVREIK